MSSATGSVSTLGHEAAVRWCAFSPDGQELATVTTNCGVHIWHLATKQCMTLGGHTNRVNCCAFSPDGKILLTVAADNTIRLWFRPFNLNPCSIIDNGTSVLFCAFSPRGIVLQLLVLIVVLSFGGLRILVVRILCNWKESNL